MEVKLIDLVFITLRISIIVVKDKCVNGRYEAIILVNKHRKKITTLNSLMYERSMLNPGFFHYYGLFENIDEKTIVDSVMYSIKKHYLSDKIKNQIPTIIASEDITIMSQSRIDEVKYYVAAEKLNVDDVAFYSFI